MQEYRRREVAVVTAVQVGLDFDGFTYRKWGGVQRCKRGDWLVDNQGDVYTVDGDVFARTYRRVSPGVYAKHGSVWARRADQAGVIRTKEGSTEYAEGDYLVYNNRDGTDGYAMTAETFRRLYEPVEA